MECGLCDGYIKHPVLQSFSLSRNWDTLNFIRAVDEFLGFSIGNSYKQWIIWSILNPRKEWWCLFLLSRVLSERGFQSTAVLQTLQQLSWRIVFWSILQLKGWDHQRLCLHVFEGASTPRIGGQKVSFNALMLFTFLWSFLIWKFIFFTWFWQIFLFQNCGSVESM